MPRTLTTMARASIRMVLVCYTQQHPESKAEVYRRLKDQTWAPTPDDCPVAWEAMQQWYNGLQRTGQLVMDSY